LILTGSQCSTSCPNGTFLNFTSCVRCYQNCAACTGNEPNQCTSCIQGNFFNGNNTCVSSCPSGTYPNTTTNTCPPCGNGCSSCSGPQVCLSPPHHLTVPLFVRHRLPFWNHRQQLNLCSMLSKLPNLQRIPLSLLQLPQRHLLKRLLLQHYMPSWPLWQHCQFAMRSLRPFLLCLQRKQLYQLSLLLP
jgi:hypothetical protein